MLRSLARPRRSRRNNRTQPAASPIVVLGDELVAPLWDEFLERTPGGSYLQSSMWAQVKAGTGWRPLRLTAHLDGVLVGGCQLLTRDVGRLGTVAYSPRGPVVSPDQTTALDALLEAMARLARTSRIRYLKVQPPTNREDLPALLQRRGYVESGLDVTPRATVRVPVHYDLDEVLASLPGSTRRKIRKAKMGELNAREGGESDLKSYYKLLEETSRRQSFSPYPRAYYERIWRAFAATGNARLTVVEHGNTPVSSALLIAFGDTVVAKLGVWSGLHRNSWPNELLHWTGITLAHQHNYHYYDFDGLSRLAEQAVLGGVELPVGMPQGGVAKFKLGFGGCTRFPGTYDTSGHPALAVPIRWLSPRLDQPWADTMAKRLLGMGG